MASTMLVITTPQNTSIVTIIPIPQAPHIHDIGCMPPPHYQPRSWAHAKPGALVTNVMPVKLARL